MDILANNLEEVQTVIPEKSPEELAADPGMAERDLATVAKRVAGEEVMMIHGIEREVSEGEESMVLSVGDAPVATQRGAKPSTHGRQHLHGAAVRGGSCAGRSQYCATVVCAGQRRDAVVDAQR